MIMDNEKLILLVKQNDVLYNKENPLFKHPDKKREVWQEIAEEMEVSEKACKKRWTSLRDRYSLECRRMKTEEDYKPSWVFMELMEFLRSHITPRPDRQHYNVRESRYDIPFRPKSVKSEFFRFFGKKDDEMNDMEFKQSIKSSSESDSDDDSVRSSSLNPTFKGYPRSAEPKKPTLRRTLKEMRNNPFLPQNPTLQESLIEFTEEQKRRKFKEANHSVFAFGEMIVATICSMHPRNQIKAMQKATDIVMKIKLEEEL